MNAMTIDTIQMLEEASALMFRALRRSMEQLDGRDAGRIEYDSWSARSPGETEYASWSATFR